MADNRITSVEMHAKLGAAIDRAMVDPIIVTKHGRDHLVMLSAERYAALLTAAKAQLPARVKSSRLARAR